MLTERFARAVDYARIANATQVRKGTSISYITHLLGVAALVLEYGGSEDQAIADLLHDTVEDCGQAHRDMIRSLFGSAVADIVEGCTDGAAEDKDSHVDPEAKRKDWLRRKHAYLAHLAHADAATLLVSACDKLYNARAITQNLVDPGVGTKVFERFTGGRDGTLGYYESLARTFAGRDVAAAPALEAEVTRMHVLAGEAGRRPMPVAGSAA